MRYTKPQLEELGSVHSLTLTKGGNNDNPCSTNSTGKCLNVGDGHSQEAGYGLS